MIFGNLRLALDVSGKPHYRIAQLTGMHPTHLSRGINQAEPFSSEEKERLAQVLGVDVKWLFRRTRIPQHTTRVREVQNPTAGVPPRPMTHGLA